MFYRTWSQLRAVGNLQLLKVSYAALVVVPLLSHHAGVVEFLGIKVWFLATLFFGSVFLAIANLIYDISCPEIVKKFASPDEYYQKMLEVKELSQRVYKDDEFTANLSHCTETYTSASRSKPVSRLLCSLLYIVSGVLFLLALSYRLFLVSRDLLASFGQ